MTMKFNDWITIETSVGTPRNDEVRARAEMHAVTVRDDAETIAEAGQRAAELAMRGAGLRAAIYFRQDILPFLELGQAVSSSGKNVGHVTLINKTPGSEQVVVDWGTGEQTHLAPGDLAYKLRDGGWRLA